MVSYFLCVLASDLLLSHTLSFLSLQQSDEVELECSPDGEPEESGGMSRRSSFRPRDADDFFDRDEVKANARWKVWAASLDDLSRVLVPAMYAIIVGVFLSEHNFTYN